MKKWKAPLLVLVLLLLGVAAGIRIYYVNSTAMQQQYATYQMNEQVDLDGDFMVTYNESTQGYSVKVLDARVVDYEAYVRSFGVEKDYLPEADQPLEVAELTVEFTNQGNETGYYDIGETCLVYLEHQLRLNSKLWKLAVPTSGGSRQVRIRPNTTRVVKLPLVLYTEFNQPRQLVENLPYRLVVSMFPVQKSIEIKFSETPYD